MTATAIDELLGRARRLENLSEAVIKDIYHRAAVTPRGHELWFKGFAEAVLHSTGSDFFILRPAAILLIDKYRLLVQ